MHRVASRFACEGCPTTDEIRSHDHNERGLRVCDCIPIAINLLPCELRTHSNLREIHGLVEILHLVTIAFVCFCSIHWYSFSSVWGICVARYRLDAEDAYTCRSWEKALKEPNGKKPQATAAGPVIPRYIAGESDESDGDGLYEEPSDNDAGPSRSAHTVHMYTGCPSMFVSFCWDDIVEFSLKSLITVACLVIFDFNFFLCMSVKVRDLIAQCF
eukprot:m.1373659 g.1373659  ORF g.1373659 m.1373659 type:complete len:215 (-) comp24956_c0_seq6:2290-2934(-)